MTRQREVTDFPRWTKIGFAGVLLMVLAAGGWFFTAQQGQQRREVEARLWSIAQLKASQIAAWREERLADAAVLTGRRALLASVERFFSTSSEAEAAEILRRFHDIRERHHYANILLVDPEKRVRWSLSPQAEEIHQGYVSSLEFSLAGRKPVWTPLHREPEYPFPHLSVVVPLVGEEARSTPVGFVVLISDASQFLYPLLQSWPTPSDTAETLLIRRDGDEVVFLNELRHRKGVALELRFPLKQADLPAAMAVQGKTGIVEGKDYRGVEVVAAVLPIPESPWFMVAKVDADEAFAVWQFRSLLILGLILGLLALLAAAALAVRQRYLKAHYRALYRSEAALRASVEKQAVTLRAIGDAVIATDPEGRVELMNPVAEALTGWSEAEARAKALQEVFRIINEETRQRVKDPVSRVIEEGTVVGLANHTLLISRNGREIPIADSGAPIRDEVGEIIGVVLVFRDQSEERLARRLIECRLSLIQYAVDHTMDDFLTRALDETGALAGSPIGFYHFVDEDQETLCLQQWSTRTLEEFCKARGKGVHYSIQKAGVWVDCVREKRPVVHNDYASLPDRKGMPEGHPRVVRELVVPVMREGKIMAILGVGNKPTDYTDKDVEVVSYLADVTWEIVRHKQGEEALHEAHADMEQILNATVPMCAIDREFTMRMVNATFCSYFQMAREAVIGRKCYEIWKGPFCHKPECALTRIIENRSRYEYEVEKELGDGTSISCIVTAVPYVDSVGNLIGVLENFTDITDRRRGEKEREKLQNQLAQAQKMESVGRLAGGVAHDFNNKLTVILGYAQMAMEKLSKTDPIYANLQQVMKAGEQSVQIVSQLLAFARKQTIAPKVLDLNETIEGMLKMLRRLIGEDIDLAWEPDSHLWPVKMDPSQIDQILANLCVNSRDAITGAGKVTIETENVVLDENYCADRAGFVPGDYVMLGVSDNGCGMDRETLANAFEPFFTTKEVGKGTGLGLSTVYGIVRQNQGFVNIYSEPGKGTTFKIYLPRHSEEAQEKPEAVSTEIPRGRGEAVLVVEDDAPVLELVERILLHLGYAVLRSASPAEAVNMAREYQGEIQLLITDVVLPEMSGKELAGEMLKVRPNIKTMFMSGYTADVIAHRGVLDDGVQFIGKPFTPDSLARKVREALGSEK